MKSMRSEISCFAKLVYDLPLCDSFPGLLDHCRRIVAVREWFLGDCILELVLIVKVPNVMKRLSRTV